MKRSRPPHNTPRPAGKNSNQARNSDSRSRGPRRGKEASPTLLHLFGIHTVRAALENAQRKSTTLFATENGLNRLGETLVAENGVTTEMVEPRRLDQMVGAEAVHQGVVLACHPLDTLDSSELFHLVDEKLLLVLDQITDPHNVGAILRSAVAMNVAAVLVTSRNSAVETAVLAKSASGALDMIRVIEIRNLSKALEELNDMGFATVGLDSEGPEDLETTFTLAVKKPIALVLGAEGRGLREKTRETCTALARLDMPGAIKSLNVSNAAALSLYAATKHLQRLTK